jgi:hypothetical protein
MTGSYVRFSIAEEWAWLWLAAVVGIIAYAPLAIWSLNRIKDKSRRKMTLIMIA